MAGENNNQLLYPESVSFDEEKFTLLLYLNETVIDFKNLAETATRNSFDKKDEFHITVIGFKGGMAVKEALDKLSQDEKHVALQQIRSLMARTNWGFTFLPQKYHITKEYISRTGTAMSTEHRESYIQMVAMPDVATFYDALNRILSTGLKPPPPHLTLYTHGDNRERARAGIGINSQEEFLKLNPQLLT